MLVKIKTNGTVQKAPNKIVIINPTEEQLLMAGYLIKKDTPRPETDDNHYAESFYEQEGNYAVQKWVVHEIPNEVVAPDMEAEQV